jgi:hypothetical protein
MLFAKLDFLAAALRCWIVSGWSPSKVESERKGSSIANALTLLHAFGFRQGITDKYVFGGTLCIKVTDTVSVEGHFLANILHVVCRTPCADPGLKVSVVHKVTSSQLLPRHWTSIVVLRDPFQNDIPLKIDSCPG